MEAKDNKRKAEYYLDKNPDWTIEQCEEAAKQFRKSCCKNSLEFFIRFYPDLTLEECKKKHKEHTLNRRKNDPSKIEYYEIRFPELSDLERKQLQKEHNKQHNYNCIEYYQVKYPDLSHEEHLRMKKEKLDSIKALGKTKGENNGNHKTKTTEYERRSRSPRCIEFYQRKYPNSTEEEHNKMLTEYFNKNRERVKNTIKDTNIEYYLNQGMSELEAKLALKQRQSTFSLEKCIAKYGTDKGEQIFNERQYKWIKALKKNFSDNGFNNLFQSKLGNCIISELFSLLNIKETDADNYTEIYLHDYLNNRGYIYDFVYENKIIEINGDYWHCNPNIYNEDFINKSKNKTAKQIWEIDNRKMEIAEENGYKFLVIWESEYNENQNETINKCIEFLTNEKCINNDTI